MQQGGSPYGTPPPDMTLFSSSLQPPSAAAAVQQQQQQMAAVTAAAVAEPINVRPPPSLQQQVPSAGPNYEELGSAEDPLGDEAVGGGGMSGGNRWPRQETLALLKIRSDMDAAFRDANLKGPLWEEVSRKLAELGYRRSAKKCKEKFENVHKYYKRTKEGRAGRQDGKSYRFFTQLEALHNTPGASSSSPSMFAPSPSSTATMMGAGSTGGAAANPSARFQTPQQQQQQQIQQHHHQPQQISAPMPIATAPPQPSMVQMFGQEQSVGAAVAAAGISFSSNTSSDAASDEDDVDEDEEDDEATEEGPSGGVVGKKRKREGEGGGSRKMMAFFEGLMRQVMERQEAMQQRFLEAIEVREKDRMIREEAWRRQEMARLAREHEIEAAERAAAAARDAAVISFLQKLTGQSVPGPTQTTPTTPAPVPAQAPSAAVSIVPTPSQPQPIHHQPPTSTSTSTPTPPSQPQQQQYHQTSALMLPPPRPTSTELVPLPSEPHEGASAGSMSLDPASSRWPKSEVHALIKLRSGLDSRYQESGPKGPLWEEISAGMRGLGYNRSSKRCKEKWENINKYFKKVKESNKKRPEDAKTCPYFHQLDALYRSKQLGNTSSVMPALTQRTQESETQPSPISIMPPPPQQQQQQQQQQQPMNQGDMDTKKDAGGGGSNNGGLSSTFFGDNGGNGDNSTNAMMKKPEDIVKELMGQSNNNEYGRADEPDSDNMDEDDVDDEDDEEEDDGKAQYRIQFQRQNVSGGNGNGGATAAPSSGGGGGKTAAGSFLAMVR